LKSIYLIQIFRPQNKEELFNLRHASARNVVERIFGVLKKRFSILNVAPQFDMAIQARIPAALAAIHNFIIDHDPEELTTLDHSDIDDLQSGAHFGSLAEGPASRAERARANSRRDEIAAAMWAQYMQLQEE
jgi:hypothetical protein